MKSGGSKSKGSSFEREIAVKLSLWISFGKRKDVFWRSSMSGGRATVALNSGLQLKSQAGDVSAIAAIGEKLLDTHMVECKAYKDLQVLQGFIKGTGKLYKFWEKAKQEAAKYGKRPLLIARQNQMPTFILMGLQDVFMFGLEHNISCVATFPRLTAYMFLFDGFLKQARVPGIELQVIPHRQRSRL